MIWYSAGVNDLSWVGCYITVASLVSIAVVLTNATLVFHQGKYRFPIFNINIVYIIFLQTMMMPVDITTDITIYNINIAKAVNLMFFYTMLGNFLPSLGVMNIKEFAITSIVFVIVYFNYIFNLLITEWSHIPSILLPILINMFTIPLVEVLVAPIVRTKVKKKIQRLPSCLYREIELRQFLIAYSPGVAAFGFVIIAFAVHLLVTLNSLRFETDFWYGNNSKYKWWIKVIVFVQTMGVLLGSITLTVRGFDANVLFSEIAFNHLNLFKAGKHSYTKLLRKSKREHRQRAKEPKRRH